MPSELSISTEVAEPCLGSVKQGLGVGEKESGLEGQNESKERVPSSSTVMSSDGGGLSGGVQHKLTIHTTQPVIDASNSLCAHLGSSVGYQQTFTYLDLAWQQVQQHPPCI